MRIHDDTLVVLGPPGTGKTTRLMREVETAIESGIAPERIGYVAFTRKASRESVSRAAERFGLERSKLPNFRTLHALCYRELGLSDTDIVKDSHIREFGDMVGLSVAAKTDDNEGRIYFSEKQADFLLKLEQDSRIRRIPLRVLRNQIEADVLVEELERTAAAYSNYKRERDLLDYTDMLERFLDFPDCPQFDLLLVDEGQDLSPLQWEVVQKLARHSGRVVIAGDDDQAIYRWAGASVDDFIGLEGRVEVLGQSYRVPRQVQRIADSIISRVKHRHEKQWAPREHEGSVRWASSDREIDLSEGEWLILARNHYVLGELADDLYASGVPFDRGGVSCVPATLADAVSSWSALSAGKEISYPDAINLYNYMRVGRGVARGEKKILAKYADMEGTVDMAELRERHGLTARGPWSAALDKIAEQDRTFLLRSESMNEDTASPRIRLSSIHASKGGEADNVVLYSDLSYRTYKGLLSNPDDEARVFYVGATRARESLTVVSPQTRFHFGI